jgi:hypothetical protein
MSYLINGDASGLSAIDKISIDNWYQSWLNDAYVVNGSVVISPTGEREFYTNYPEFGRLACDCIECDIAILVEG